MEMTIENVLKKAEISAKENQEIRDLRNCPNLKGGRQGDVYIVRCDTESDQKKLEKMFQNSKNPNWQNFNFGDKFVKRKTNQLADGSSKGSRHLVDEHCEILFSENGHPCSGGIITSKKEWNNTHPEHAHFIYIPGRFVFFFQMDARKESEVARVRD